jgi:hypothetical protein
MLDRGRLNQHQCVSPLRPDPSQDQPQQTVRWAEAPIRTPEYGKLMAQGKHLEQQVAARPQGQSDRRDHPGDLTHRP